MSDSVWLTPHVAVWSFSVHDDVAAGTHGLRANHLGQFVVWRTAEKISHIDAHISFVSSTMFIFFFKRSFALMVKGIKDSVLHLDDN
jgi:hypothetical protein